MSPREIPGIPFGRLPDKRSTGRCLNCFREFRSVKIFVQSNNKIIHLCPSCGSKHIHMKKK